MNSSSLSSGVRLWLTSCSTFSSSSSKLLISIQCRQLRIRFDVSYNLLARMAYQYGVYEYLSPIYYSFYLAFIQQSLNLFMLLFFCFSSELVIPSMISITLLMKNTKKNIIMRMDILVKTTEGGLRGVISPQPTVLTVCKAQQMAQLSQIYHPPGQVAMRSVPWELPSASTENAHMEKVSQFSEGGQVLLIQNWQSMKKKMEESHTKMKSMQASSLMSLQAAQANDFSSILSIMLLSTEKIVGVSTQKKSFRKMRFLYQESEYISKTSRPNTFNPNLKPKYLLMISLRFEIRYPKF